MYSPKAEDFNRGLTAQSHPRETKSECCCMAPERRVPKCLARAKQIMILFVGNFIYSTKVFKHFTGNI